MKNDKHLLIPGEPVPSLNRAVLWLVLLFWAAGISAPAFCGQKLERLETMVVTADRIEEYIRRNPRRVAVIERDEIVKRNFGQVAEALASMPGVDLVETGTGIRILINGYGGGRVPVLINGRPMNSGRFQVVGLDAIPIETVERIVVFKPPVPVWLGPASGGAVNIITARSDPGAEKSADTAHLLKAGGGSYGRAEVSYTVTSTAANRGSIFSVGAGHVDKKRPNADRNSLRMSLHLDRETARFHRFQVDARYYRSSQGVPGPTYNPTPDARQDYQKGSFDLEAKGFAGTRGEYLLNGYLEAESLDELSQSGSGSKLDQYRIGIKGEHKVNLESKGIRIGCLLEQTGIDHTGSGKHARERISVHAHLDRRFDRIIASCGARGEWTSDFDLSGNLQGGVTIPLGRFQLKSNAGYTQDLPSFSELYQPSHGSVDHVAGNSHLGIEKVLSLDIGIEFKIPESLDAGLALFRTDYRDKIIYREDSNMVYVPENIPRAWRQGVELNATWRINEEYSVDADYIYQDSRVDETGGDLAYAPSHRLKLTCRASWHGTRLEATLRAVSSSYSDPEKSRSKRLDGYFTADLKAVHPLKVKGVPVDLFLDIKNITGTDFEAHRGYPDDGFRLFSGLKIGF